MHCSVEIGFIKQVVSLRRYIKFSSFGIDKSVMVHPADNQPFEANMIHARYYDDHVGYITLQGFNDEGRPTGSKAIEVGTEFRLFTVFQDSTRLGLADLISDPDV